MSEASASVSHETHNVPPGMYEGGFAGSREAVEQLIHDFDFEPPVELYYPGSSTDVSLTGIEGVHTIHADEILDEAGQKGFESLGAEAHCVNVEEWSPPGQVDIVAFINSTGIDESRVLDITHLNEGGIVMWASHSGPSMALQESERLELVGVIATDEDGHVSPLDRNELEDYFTVKTYGDLTDVERQTFGDRIDSYLEQNALQTSMSREETYDWLQHPENAMRAIDVNYPFPPKKQGTFFVYQSPMPAE